MTGRQEQLARTFVDAADPLADGFDVLEFVGELSVRCGELFPGVDAGIAVLDPAAAVVAVASSDAHLGLLEASLSSTGGGPAPECIRTGTPVERADLAGATKRWPAFASGAVEAGFATVQALPMKRGEQRVGVLELLGRDAAPFGAADLAMAQAIADVATIGLLQHRVARDARARADELQDALASRVTIEQAKGVLAALTGHDPDTAFAALRRYARDRNTRLVDVAGTVVDRTLPVTEILPVDPASPPGTG